VQLQVYASGVPVVPSISVTANYARFGEPADIPAPPVDQVAAQA
jgi:hypothetical protein